MEVIFIIVLSIGCSSSNFAQKRRILHSSLLVPTSSSSHYFSIHPKAPEIHYDRTNTSLSNHKYKALTNSNSKHSKFLVEHKKQSPVGGTSRNINNPEVINNVGGPGFQFRIEFDNVPPSSPERLPASTVHSILESSNLAPSARPYPYEIITANDEVSHKLETNGPFVVTNMKQFITTNDQSSVSSSDLPQISMHGELMESVSPPPHLSNNNWHAVTVEPFTEKYIPNGPFIHGNQISFQIKNEMRTTGRPANVVSNAPYDIIGHVTGTTLRALTGGSSVTRSNPIDGNKHMKFLSTTKAPTNIWYKPVINHYGGSGQITHPELLLGNEGMISTTTSTTATSMPEIIRSTAFPSRKNKPNGRKEITIDLPVTLNIWKFEKGQLTLLSVRKIPRWIFNNYELKNGDVLNLNDLPPDLKDIIVEAFNGQGNYLQKRDQFHWQELPMSHSQQNDASFERQRRCQYPRTCINYVVWTPNKYDTGHRRPEVSNPESSSSYYEVTRDQLLNQYWINSFDKHKSQAFDQQIMHGKFYSNCN